ncbi:hypothetical protein [Brevundimonas sp.]|uniref:hypothetical protein n=1 Tax=Brevundimonas sp. TaxID=1871086 RepID=UPI001ACBF005|nr:hypothetical protein [Brevundimonas sp.]MBN9466173.1 hypothetical protein [Brevundimonas sp.]
MNALLPLALLIAVSAQPDRSQSYLVSIVDVPLQAGESLERFALSTLGVSYQAICKLPEGWTIKAGSSIRGDGVLEGEGSNGVTWLPRSSPPELEAIALVTLEIESAPNSFSGSATIAGIDGEREVALTSSNVRLTAASGCRGRRVR